MSGSSTCWVMVVGKITYFHIWRLYITTHTDKVCQQTWKGHAGTKQRSWCDFWSNLYNLYKITSRPQTNKKTVFLPLFLSSGCVKVRRELARFESPFANLLKSPLSLIYSKLLEETLWNVCVCVVCVCMCMYVCKSMSIWVVNAKTVILQIFHKYLKRNLFCGEYLNNHQTSL